MEEVLVTNWRSLIKPKGVERDHDSSNTYGKFVVRPLERGFGTTLGNSSGGSLLFSSPGCGCYQRKV